MPEHKQPSKREQKAAEEMAEAGVAPTPSGETAIDPSTVHHDASSTRVNAANRAPEAPDPVKAALDASEGLPNPLMDAKGAASTQVVHHVDSEEDADAPKRRARKAGDDEDKPENANDKKLGQVINGER